MLLSVKLKFEETFHYTMQAKWVHYICCIAPNSKLYGIFSPVNICNVCLAIRRCRMVRARSEGGPRCDLIATNSRVVWKLIFAWGVRARLDRNADGALAPAVCLFVSSFTLERIPTPSRIFCRPSNIHEVELSFGFRLRVSLSILSLQGRRDRRTWVVVGDKLIP